MSTIEFDGMLVSSVLPGDTMDRYLSATMEPPAATAEVGSEPLPIEELEEGIGEVALSGANT